MTSPFLDPVGTSGHGTGSAVTGATGSGGLSSLITVDFGGVNTFNTNDVLLVLISWSNAAGATRTLTSATISGGAHGPYTFNTRTTFASAPRSGGAVFGWVELSNQEQGTPLNITANLSGGVDHLQIIAVAYSGCFDITNPFDSNIGLLNSGNGNWANYTSSPGSYSMNVYSTAQSNDTIIQLQAGGFASGPTSAAITGFTQQNGNGNSGGSDWASSGMWDDQVSSPQTAVAVPFTVGANGGGTGSPLFMAIDALTADNNSGAGSETATAALVLQGVSFDGATFVAQEAAHASITIGGVTFAATTFRFAAGSIFNSFSTFGA